MWDMTNPAELLIWGRGISDAEQIRQCQISMLVPENRWRQLLSIEDTERRLSQWDALVRGYLPRWRSEQDERDRVERFICHLGVHYGCPGARKCDQFSGGPVEDQEGRCRICGGRVKSPDHDLCWKCWKAGK